MVLGQVGGGKMGTFITQRSVDHHTEKEGGFRLLVGQK